MIAVTLYVTWYNTIGLEESYYKQVSSSFYNSIITKWATHLFVISKP